MSDRHQELVEAISRHAYREGSFVLASGQVADYYIDGKMATLRGDVLLAIGDELVDMAIEDNASAIGGLVIGADPLAVAATMCASRRGLDIPAFLVRKEAKAHGTHKFIEGPDIRGKRVIIVDDVVTTGGSIMDAYRRVQQAGAVVTRLSSVVHRGPGSKKSELPLDVPYTPILTIDEIKSFVRQQNGALLSATA